MEEKIALAACSGMSPNGLVARVAVHDLAIDDVEILSICMGSTSANVTGFKRMLDKYPILAINGCEGNCVGKILEQKGIEIADELNVGDILAETEHKANDAARLDEEGEICVSIVKEVIENNQTTTIEVSFASTKNLKISTTNVVICCSAVSLFISVGNSI